MSDAERWATMYDGDMATLLRAVEAPQPHQVELADLLNNLARREGLKSSIELGAGYGITTLRLLALSERTILDSNPESLAASSQLFERLGERIAVLEKDFFALGDFAATYDLVFNAGVIEHFASGDRIRLLEVMRGLARPGGYVVVGYPNHGSVPYRYSYRYQVRKKLWTYPPEHHIRHFGREAKAAGLQVCDVAHLDHETIFCFLPWRAKRFFRALARVFPLQGYLTTWILKRP